MNVGKLRRKMAAWFGETFYWTATVIAGLLLAWVLWSYAFYGIKGEPIIEIVPLVLSAAIWLTGWACRSLYQPGRRKAARGGHRGIHGKTPRNQIRMMTATKIPMMTAAEAALAGSGEAWPTNPILSRSLRQYDVAATERPAAPRSSSLCYNQGFIPGFSTR